ncbi:ribonuclease P protein component [Dongia deserti]|uniref:ribonuclease P protein component n=1 Tax=Dongia deserti TaxID=2268030 RepID=UPI000E65D345|nr:ribonuclease P protein component [Dongia deserti]
MIGRLKRRAEFLQVAAANRKWVAPGLILQVRRQPSPETESDDAPRAVRPKVVRAPVRVGFTASRKVGNAVQRNRARRRLRAVANEVLDVHAEPGTDFVLIARPATVDRNYQALVGDLVAGLKRLKLYREAPR